ncbi:MAG: YkgJ family cysteine cluster protein [Deltaproteobacteria bacterium]|nr:YkgJ family cysteine cluster protein [Deltaproteobacteria bacterium]MBW2658390.1 YkgJ family cysteine cluster protein [Deltaproteobacteria bacterium]
MKNQILKKIYTLFTEWSSHGQIACRKGCAVCCTRNVTITALEGEIILRFIIKHKMAQWFGEKLKVEKAHHRPKMSTNDFARACLQERNVDFSETPGQAPCPFLEENICRIYPARPFGCRMMISERTCTADQPALLPERYLAASTAVTQIIEHLGQKEYWGNMLDVLPALCDISEFSPISRHLSTADMMQARLRTLTAKPLPGFLFTEEEEQTVSPLLQTLFDTEIEGKRIEDILNGNY